MNAFLFAALVLAALGQALIALINFNLVRIMGWRDELAKTSLLVREVFHVHAAFVSITLLIFAVLTWRFAREIAAGEAPVFRWLACGMGFFWATRALVQVAYYSGSHWRGIPSRTAVHVLLLCVYAGWGALYLLAALRP